MEEQKNPKLTKKEAEISNKSIWELIGTQYDSKEVKEEDSKNLNFSKRKEFELLEKQKEEEGEAKGQWAVHGSTYWPCSEAIAELPAGIYSAHMTMSGEIYFRKHKVITDELIKLPDSNSEMVLAHIQEFRSLKEEFSRHGFIYKRGVLLWGPQGSGKTCTVAQVMQEFVESGGIAILGDCPVIESRALKELRGIEPDKPVVVIFEDVDDLIRMYGDRALTKLLDGEDNVENVLFLATTNYPERLPPRLLNRPSRFDIIQYIGLPGEAARLAYLKAKTNLTPSEAQRWAKKTDNLTIPHLKELIILVKVYKKDLDESIMRLKNMSKMPSSGVYYGRRNNEINLNVEIAKEKQQEPQIINVSVPHGKKRITKSVTRDSNDLIVKVIEEEENIVEEDKS